MSARFSARSLEVKLDLQNLLLLLPIIRNISLKLGSYLISFLRASSLLMSFFCLAGSFSRPCWVSYLIFMLSYYSKKISHYVPLEILSNDLLDCGELTSSFKFLSSLSSLFTWELEILRPSIYLRLDFSCLGKKFYLWWFCP